MKISKEMILKLKDKNITLKEYNFIINKINKHCNYIIYAICESLDVEIIWYAFPNDNYDGNGNGSDGGFFNPKTDMKNIIFDGSFDFSRNKYPKIDRYGQLVLKIFGESIYIDSDCFDLPTKLLFKSEKEIKDEIEEAINNIKVQKDIYASASNLIKKIYLEDKTASVGIDPEGKSILLYIGGNIKTVPNKFEGFKVKSYRYNKITPIK
jgi:hypothetical protein